MASVDCIIDTQEMADQLNSVSHHVNATTAAVVAMKGAVIKAEKDAADQVCDNVNRGFLTLIRSQISQKMANLISQSNSRLMQLQQQRRQLISIKSRMQHDYSMITARYTKLFTTLNRSLKQRIYELDKPAFDFADRDVQQVSNRSFQLTSTVPISQLESVTLSQRILASGVKHHTMNVIGSLTSFLSDNARQEEITSHILINQPISTDVTYMIPSIIIETSMGSSGTSSLQVICGKRSPELQKTLRNTIMNSADSLPWTAPGPISNEVMNEFNRMLSNSKASDRIRKTVYMLIQNSATQNLKYSQP